jgi:hypothetical protein
MRYRAAPPPELLRPSKTFANYQGIILLPIFAVPYPERKTIKPFLQWAAKVKEFFNFKNYNNTYLSATFFK